MARGLVAAMKQYWLSVAVWQSNWSVCDVGGLQVMHRCVWFYVMENIEMAFWYGT